MILKPLALCAALWPGLLMAGSALEVMEHRGDMLGWEAVGRVDLADGGFCTGVLIAPDLVLTAAHCLYNKETGQVQDARHARFRAGYLNGSALSERTVEKYFIADGYKHAGGAATAETIPRDVALLKLNSPIFSSEADPFLVHQEAGDVSNVQVMSYGRGRAQAMSWQRRCNMLRRYRDILVFDCDTTFGSSGAPVFVKHGTRVRILSLVSGGRKTDEGGTIVYGMALDKVVAELRQKMRGSSGITQNAGTGVKRIRVGAKSTSSGGARFLKAPSN